MRHGDLSTLILVIAGAGVSYALFGALGIVGFGLLLLITGK